MNSKLWIYHGYIPSNLQEEGKKRKGGDTTLDIDSDDEEQPLISPEPEDKKPKKGKKGEVVEQVGLFSGPSSKYD